MTEIASAPFQRKVSVDVHRRNDLDIHVSRITVEDAEYVDVREYIPSLQQYGRGILIPMRLAAQIGTSVAEIAADLDG